MLRRAICIFGLAICAQGRAENGVSLAPGDYTRYVMSNGARRMYLLHIPAKYKASEPAAVALAFHGGGSNPKEMVEFSGLNEKSDQEGFIVVYPYGSGRLPAALTFNAGNCCGYASRNNVDDVEFTRRILDDLAQLCNIDAKRVYATGMSNGAIMAYRLAAELSDRIAAIAPVAGTMGVPEIKAKRPVPIMHFHGTADESLPFEGGFGKGLSGVNFLSVEKSIQAWIKFNGCKEEPVVEALPDRANDGTRVVRKVYGGGADGAEVVLIVIEGGGHTWPGRDAYRKRLGVSTKDISANDLMWDFFRAHPMP